MSVGRRNGGVVERVGRGPEVVLVHGGAGPQTTWHGLQPLAARWTLGIVHRRGFSPSPPPAGGRQDFDQDAADILTLLERRTHVVAHSFLANGPDTDPETMREFLRIAGAPVPDHGPLPTRERLEGFLASARFGAFVATPDG